MAEHRRPPVASRLAVAVATLALLAGCTTSAGDDDADVKDPTTTAKRSTDWQRRTLDGPKLSRDLSAINDGELLSDGADQSWLLSGSIDTLDATKPVVWRSPDRSTWDRQELPGRFADITNVELAVGDDQALALGRNEAPDGPSAPVWELQKNRWKAVDADLPDDAHVTVAIRSAKAWFAMGSVQAKDGSRRDVVWRSTDAERWKRVFTVPDGGDLTTLAGLANVAVGGTVGAGDEQRSVVWFSEDGTSWSRPSDLPAVPFTTRTETETESRDTTAAVLSSLAQGDRGWMAVGSAVDQGRTKPVTWSSDDGAVWRAGEVIPPWLEEARGGFSRKAQRVAWVDGAFIAYGGSDKVHETWIYEPFSGYWVDAAIPKAFIKTEDRGGFTALIGDASGKLLLATVAGGQAKVWMNGNGSFDNEVTDAKLMPDDADYTDTYNLQIRNGKIVVVGRFGDGSEHPVLWTGSDVRSLRRASGSDGLSGTVDVATVTDRHVVIWGSAADYSLMAWRSPIGRPGLAVAADVGTAIGATNTPAGVTSIHASFDIGDRTFVAGVNPKESRAVPAIWAVKDDTFTEQPVSADGPESVQVFTGGCGGRTRGIAHGVAYGDTVADDNQPIAAVIARDGTATDVDRAQLQPKGTVAKIVTCAVDRADLVLGGSLSRDGGPARPTLWTSKDGKRWKIDDDLSAAKAGRVYRLVSYQQGLAAIVEDSDDVSSVWRTGKDGDGWERLSKPSTFGGSTVYVNGFAATAEGQLVVAGASRRQATIWTLAADREG